MTTQNPDTADDSPGTTIEDIGALQTQLQAQVSDASKMLSRIQGILGAATTIQSGIATKSGHIEDAHLHADTVRGKLDQLLTTLATHEAKAAEFVTRAESASDEVAKTSKAVKANRAASQSDADAVAVSRKSAEQSAAELKVLSDRAESVDEIIKSHEARLTGLAEQCDAQLKTITGLLPGATSAGLAHAFDIRRQTFLKPGMVWQGLFVGSLVMLIVLAATGMLHVFRTDHVVTYDELFRLWISRLPVAGALVWLAIHASRESALAKRMEEDYGYKAAIAASFQGFQKQMADVTAAVGADSPLGRLCGDTLSTIANPPGRIYDKHELAVSPTSELKDVAQAVTGGAKKPA